MNSVRPRRSRNRPFRLLRARNHKQRRIGEHVIRLEIRMPVVVKRVAVGDLSVDAAYREIHLRQTPRGVVRLLTVDGNVADPAAVRFDELLARHKHPAGTAARIVNASLVWSEHFDQHTHHAGRRLNCPPFLPSALANWERKYS